MKINVFLLVIFLVNQYFGFSQELNPDADLFTKSEIEWIKKHPVINFGYEPNWPPYEIYENGVYTGISGDYIKMIEIHTDIDMVPIPNITWQETLSGLQDGEIKVAALAGITQEREKYLHFTEPHITDPIVIVTQSGYKFISGVSDLEGKTLTLPEGYYAMDLIKNDFSKINIKTTKNVKDCLYLVSTGQADAFIGSLSVTSYYINNDGFSNLKIAAPTHYGYTKLGLAVTKDWGVFRDIVQKIFDHLKKDEHLEIRNKWVTVAVEKGVSRSTIKKYILYSLGVLTIIIFVFLLWNKTLRNEIKARKKIELDLKKENQEKELLLKEVHHRVKNNLQIVHSMLNMQSRKVDNEIALKVISESKSRVMAMAIIHKILYESEDLSTIDVHKYILSLSENIKRIYKSENQDISLIIDVNNVFLNIEKAIPIGLILNELLSNSYKHAFKNRIKGEIKIIITQDKNNCNFIYTDDGVGVNNSNKESSKTLGMHLVHRLANQLQTKASLKYGTGYYLSFAFKI